MERSRPLRILIVDDSAVMRSLLRSVVSADPLLDVVGTAADGEAALNSIGALRPDLILLDVEMPVMDGLATLRELRRRGHKMPVIVCSALTQRGAQVTIEALASGASDYVAKPSGQADREAAAKALGNDLRPKIHALARVSPAAQPVSNARPFRGAAPLSPGFFQPPAALSRIQQMRNATSSAQPAVLAIGVSTGGPAALDILLPQFPADFPLPVLVVQHMPELFTRLFAERLNGHCPLRVSEAAAGDVVKPGTISIARGNWHMEVLAAAHASSPPTLQLSQGPPENHCRPAVDVLFRSVAAGYGAGALAVVLTGMGSDGMLGCRVIRDRGGVVIAQDEASSAVWGMPGAVVQAGLAQKVLPLHDIGFEILRLANRMHNEARLLRESVS